MRRIAPALAALLLAVQAGALAGAIASPAETAEIAANGPGWKRFVDAVSAPGHAPHTRSSRPRTPGLAWVESAPLRLPQFKGNHYAS